MKHWKRRRFARRVDQRQYVVGAAAPPADYVLTPGGYRHRSMVCQLPPGAYIRRRGGSVEFRKNGSRKLIDRCRADAPYLAYPEAGSGWAAWASWQNPTETPISEFVTTWVVPQPPQSQVGQTVFLFNSLENAAQTEIIQPVLQWGNPNNEGGNYWAIRTWYVAPGAMAIQNHDPIQVSVGSTLTGRIGMVPGDGGYVYSVQFDGYPDLNLSVDVTNELVLATETLESYGIYTGDEYPSDNATKMSSIQISTGGGVVTQPIWTLQVPNPVNGCPSDCSVGDAGASVTIAYR
jgi:hypothetical protein